MPSITLNILLESTRVLAGEEMYARILLDSTQSEAIVTEFYTKIEGCGRTGWVNIHTDKIYENEETYLKTHIPLLETGTILPMGRHQFPLRIMVPKDSPSSYESEFGSIRYTIQVVLKTNSEQSSCTETFPFTVISRSFFDDFPEHIMRRIEYKDDVDFTCCTLPFGVVLLKIMIPRSIFQLGEMSRKVVAKSYSSSDDNSEDLVTGISNPEESPNSDRSLDKSPDKDHLIVQPFFFNDDIIGQKYVESARLPGARRVRGTQIVWEGTQNVLELPILGHFRTYEKRTDRARPNPWRRHGALMKIYEIGGWISKMEKQQISRRNRKYFYVKAGSKPCNAPSRPPISIRESKFLPASSISILPTTTRSVDELAYVAAVHIQEAIQNALSVLLNSQQIRTTTLRNKADDVGEGGSCSSMKMTSFARSLQTLQCCVKIKNRTRKTLKACSLLIVLKTIYEAVSRYEHIKEKKLSEQVIGSSGLGSVKFRSQSKFLDCYLKIPENYPPTQIYNRNSFESHIIAISYALKFTAFPGLICIRTKANLK
ncbi:unnamed protein product [Thelazia callipaeda]|uniref:Arrestin_N domain-containing protein n=1 Tax=Thelazia callipaeda TaxID=103827 RepID=A0A0N5CVD3_THECL|nr:unnamed protein product [Thelazia callipaeda]